MTDQPWEPPQGADASYALFAKEARVRVDDGTSIAYTFRNPTGRSIPLLFANGWSCSDAYWGKLVPDLEARGHPCLIPDTRGHGASGLPRSPGRGAKNLSLADVSIPRVARDLVAVLDDAGVDRAVVIGIERYDALTDAPYAAADAAAFARMLQTTRGMSGTGQVLTVTEGQLFLDLGGDSLSGTVERLRLPG